MNSPDPDPVVPLPAGAAQASVLRHVVIALITIFALLVASPSAGAQELVRYGYDSPGGHVEAFIGVPAVPQICGQSRDDVGASHAYDDAAQLARVRASRNAGFLAPQTGGDDCEDGAILFHGTGIDAARDIVANGFSAEAAIEAGADGRFWLTEHRADTEVFAQSNPRWDQPGGEPALVRAAIPISVDRAVATGLLAREALPGAYTVVNLAGFEAIARYSLVEQ